MTQKECKKMQVFGIPILTVLIGALVAWFIYSRFIATRS